MGLLKHFRSKDGNQHAPSGSVPMRTGMYGYDLINRVPEKVLARIFTYVCPHTQDMTYLPSEESQIGDGCMLCDLRDLAKCAQVCRNWYGIAQKLLYTSVRIDAVHYCALEEVLAEKGKKAVKHFRSKNVVERVDVPNIRLQLLCRTVREQGNLAAQVEILKLPYMTRETAKGDLARTVGALPNLRYVDLPDGFFSGDPSCLPLRQELQAQCPDIRKMTYKAGSEEFLEMLTHRHWQSIEILQLTALEIEPSTLRIVLASLPVLHELTLWGMSWLDDSIFQRLNGKLPDFPSLQALKLVDIRNVSATGLNTYLEDPRNRERLFSLTLQSTGVTVAELPSVLWAASSLQHLSITETVTKSLALSAQDLPPLTSISLKTLHYEITSSEDVHGLQKPAESYYAYLATSLHRNALPALATLYVRDQHFADLLLVPAMPPLPAPRSNLAQNGTSATASDTGSLRSKTSNVSAQTSNTSKNNLPLSGGFDQTLEVFSKGIDELEWVFTSISPRSDTRKRAASGGRPLSAYDAVRGLGPQWAQGGFGGEARKSVIVGNGFGGFLAIPQEEAPRPRTADGRWGSLGSQTSGGTQESGGSLLKPPPSLESASGINKRASRHDLWR